MITIGTNMIEYNWQDEWYIRTDGGGSCGEASFTGGKVYRVFTKQDDDVARKFTLGDEGGEGWFVCLQSTGYSWRKATYAEAYISYLQNGATDVVYGGVQNLFYTTTVHAVAYPISAPIAVPCAPSAGGSAHAETGIVDFGQQTTNKTEELTMLDIQDVVQINGRNASQYNDAEIIAMIDVETKLEMSLEKTNTNADSKSIRAMGVQCLANTKRLAKILDARMKTNKEEK